MFNALKGFFQQRELSKPYVYIVIGKTLHKGQVRVHEVFDSHDLAKKYLAFRESKGLFDCSIYERHVSCESAYLNVVCDSKQ